jgi:N-acetylmuramoyl-L-alanine amidase
VTPFLNNGAGVYFNHPQSLALARSLQHALLEEFGLRDLGIGRGDLALVRPTWMPAALTESFFMIIPRQEAALRDPAVLDRIARAHLRGLEAFLREYARAEARGH